MSDELRQGRIVWAELLDPQGRNPKVRMAVIITPTTEIRADDDVIVVAVTSQTDAAPPDVCVELPWHRDGHPRTKLNRRNVAVCTWLVTIPVAEIRSLSGHVPTPELLRIIDIIAARSAGTPPPDPAS